MPTARQNILILARTFVFLALIVSACVEFEPVSPIPQITYKSMEFLDAVDELGNEVKFLILDFDFIDGDADFGVYEEIAWDSTFPDSVRYNLIVFVEKKNEGGYSPFTIWNNVTSQLDTLVLKSSIYYDERMDRVGQNKTVKGSISTSTQFAKWTEIQDTFRLRFYIRDRALNKSNTEVSNDTIFN